MIDSFKGQYEFLSNFYPCSVPYAGMWFPSVEHAYQAAKFEKDTTRLLFQYGTAAEAKKLGKSLPMRGNWEEIKLDVMEGLLRFKFTVYSNLRRYLLSTENEELVEGNWWGDVFWGVCKGVGENHLGKLLMKIRSEVQ